MASTFNDNVQNNSPKALDNKSGKFQSGAWRPYNDVAEALTSVISAYRHKGLTVNILKGGVNTEYWWRDGVADGDLIEKTSASSGSTVSDASTTVKGVVRLSTAPAIASEPIVVGDNDSRLHSHSNKSTLDSITGAGSLTYNASTGVLTFTSTTGQTSTIDLPIESLFQNASYDSATKQLTLTTSGGDVLPIDLSTLVDLPEVVVNANANPGTTPTTGQRLYFRVDNGNYWISSGGAWVGPYVGVTASEKTTWNGKQDALGFTPASQSALDTLAGTVASNTSDIAGKANNTLSGSYAPHASDTTPDPSDTLEVAISKLDKASREAASASGEQAFTNKTIDGNENTLQNIPQNAVTNLVSDLAGKISAGDLDSSAIILPELGVIISDNFDRASLGTNWTNVGSGTFGISSNQLSVSSTGGPNLNNYILWNAYGNSNLESFTIKSKIIAGAISATSYGVGFTLQNSSGSNSVQIGIDLTTANSGKITFYGGVGATNTSNNAVTSPTGLAIAEGNIVQATIKFIKNKLIVLLYNESTGRSNSFEFVIKNSYAPTAGVNIPNSFKFGIMSLGGSCFVDDFEVTANDNKNVNILIAGDSISKGSHNDNVANRWGELINNVSNTITQTNAGGGNKIEDINPNEVIALAPEKIILLLGINNLQGGDSVATFQTKYQALVTALTNGGYNVGTTLFIGLLLPNINYTASITTINSWFLSTYGGNACIDFYTPLNNNGALLYAIDGLHPTNEGNKVMANLVISKFNLASKPKKIGDYFPVLYNANNGVVIGDKNLKSSTPHAQLDIVNASSISQLRIGVNSNNEGLFAGSVLPGSAYLLGGVSYDGSSYIARAADVGGITTNAGIVNIVADKGRTIGVAAPPTARMTIDGSAGNVGIANISPTSRLDVNGSFALAISTKTSNYTATSQDHTLLVDASAGAVTITLQAANTQNRRIYKIKKIDSSANTVTIDANGSETIDGSATIVLSTQNEVKTIQCNGTAWYVI